MGDRSYTYYLFHYPMFIVAFLFFHHHFQGAFRGPWHFAVVQCVTVVALLVPFSEAVYRCIELPIAELGRAIACRMKSASAGTVRRDVGQTPEAGATGGLAVAARRNTSVECGVLAGEGTERQQAA